MRIRKGRHFDSFYLPKKTRPFIQRSISLREEVSPTAPSLHTKSEVDIIVTAESVDAVISTEGTHSLAPDQSINGVTPKECVDFVMPSERIDVENRADNSSSANEDERLWDNFDSLRDTGSELSDNHFVSLDEPVSDLTSILEMDRGVNIIVNTDSVDAVISTACVDPVTHDLNVEPVALDEGVDAVVYSGRIGAENRTDIATSTSEQYGKLHQNLDSLRDTGSEMTDDLSMSPVCHSNDPTAFLHTEGGVDIIETDECIDVVISMGSIDSVTTDPSESFDVGTPNVRVGAVDTKESFSTISPSEIDDAENRTDTASSANEEHGILQANTHPLRYLCFDVSDNDFVSPVGPFSNPTPSLHTENGVDVILVENVDAIIPTDFANTANPDKGECLNGVAPHVSVGTVSPEESVNAATYVESGGVENKTVSSESAQGVDAVAHKLSESSDVITLDSREAVDESAAEENVDAVMPAERVKVENRSEKAISGNEDRILQKILDSLLGICCEMSDYHLLWRVDPSSNDSPILQRKKPVQIFDSVVCTEKVDCATSERVYDANQTENDSDSLCSEVSGRHFVSLEHEREEEYRRHPPLLDLESMDIIAQEGLPFPIKHSLWKRVYSLPHDGASFHTFLHKLQQCQRTILAIKSAKGAIFGAYSDTVWAVQHGFFGTAHTFLYSVEDAKQTVRRDRVRDSVDAKDAVYSQHFCQCMIETKAQPKPSPVQKGIKIYRWTGINKFFQLCKMSGQRIAFGGGGKDGTFGLCLEEDFSHGTTGRCETFRNEPLTDERVFDIEDMEVYEISSNCFGEM